MSHLCHIRAKTRGTFMSQEVCKLLKIWCRRSESNRHELAARGILSPVRLPVSPLRHDYQYKEKYLLCQIKQTGQGGHGGPPCRVEDVALKFFPEVECKRFFQEFIRNVCLGIVIRPLLISALLYVPSPLISFVKPPLSENYL